MHLNSPILIRARLYFVALRHRIKINLHRTHKSSLLLEHVCLFLLILSTFRPRQLLISSQAEPLSGERQLRVLLVQHFGPQLLSRQFSEVTPFTSSPGLQARVFLSSPLSVLRNFGRPPEKLDRSKTLIYNTEERAGARKSHPQSTPCSPSRPSRPCFAAVLCDGGMTN